MLKSYYEILNVEPSATKSEIKNQYKRLVKMYHPDVNSSIEAESIFKEINKAADILLDDIKRKNYDTLRGTVKKPYTNPRKSEYSFQDLFKKPTKEEIKKEAPKPIKGDDILIDSGESYYGSNIVKQLNKKEKGMTLEAVISTHPDSDHSGGLQEVFKKMQVKKFYYPKDASYKSKTAKKLLNLVKLEKGCKIYGATPGTKINGGNNSYIKFIHSKIDYDTTNKDSVMCYVKYNNLDVLLTGDVECGAEYKSKLLKTECLT